MTWTQAQNEIRAEGRAEGRSEGIERGLVALIDTLKSVVGDDFETIATMVRKNEIYANFSDEDIKKYL